MGKKLALNVLYNLGIILCFVMIYWSATHSRFDWIIAAFFVLVMLILLKVRLAKEVRSLQKNNKP